MNETELKRRIRELNKIKKDLSTHSEERKTILKQLQELRKKLKEIKYISPEKEKLINAILKIRPEYKELNLNLNKHTLDQLQYHYDKIRKEKV